MGENMDDVDKWVDVVNWVRSELRRLDDLRQADKEAVALAHADMGHRLEGFPQQFATNDQMKGALEALTRLEKDNLSREIYETNHKALADLVSKLDRDKMPEQAFRLFVDEYRVQMENAATERRAVAAALASATADVAAGVATGTARQAGAAATWKQIAAVVGIGITVLAFTLSVVVLFANGTFG